MTMAIQIGVDLDTFWGLTPFELSCYIKAHNNNQKQQYELYAWHAANIMNCWTKKAIKPKDLLGKSNDPNNINLAKATPQQMSAFWNKMEKVSKKA